MTATSDTPQFDLVENELGQLALKRPGEEDVADVRVRRAFPWSGRDEHISIRNSEGKELLLIERLDALESNLRNRVTNWLDRHSFIPKITRINQVDVRFGFQQWDVETDRGRAQFRVQEREDIRFLTDGRFAVKDADGNVYELKSLDQFDAASRRAIEGLL
jgi:hypothetical protein